ncbi:helix-turn-helix transcriptional regulator [Tessaracoccus sp. MC1679]|uniref:helix-turn-helix domain-containing protein n=1 Tax=unclassified Tessaracoccus TaxID=2635419 RepID=UPI001603CB19|nr:MULTISPECIES: helix-turn-helix domain-containing protein [unclassified Tessaracoccus]MBB1513688.1 helix-turn-helix transcriptional regulator [Tessaracoccus sp. MC1627]MBB1515573.1 helix-turn-helix transcriptional regulator [Tessaracoccus sp. MC1679]
MDLASTVSKRRRALHLTQLDAADLAGVSERFVRAVEAGKVSVQFDKLRALLDTLGLELTVRIKP